MLMFPYPPPSQTPPLPPAGSQTTNPKAIMSLVFGVLGVFGLIPVLGPLTALYLARQAMREMANNPQAPGYGLAIAGRILGYIGVGLTLLALCGLCMYLVLTIAYYKG